MPNPIIYTDELSTDLVTLVTLPIDLDEDGLGVPYYVVYMLAGDAARCCEQVREAFNVKLVAYVKEGTAPAADATMAAVRLADCGEHNMHRKLYCAGTFFLGPSGGKYMVVTRRKPKPVDHEEECRKLKDDVNRIENELLLFTARLHGEVEAHSSTMGLLNTCRTRVQELERSNAAYRATIKRLECLLDREYLWAQLHDAAELRGCASPRQSLLTRFICVLHKHGL